MTFVFYLIPILSKISRGSCRVRLGRIGDDMFDSIVEASEESETQRTPILSLPSDHRIPLTMLPAKIAQEFELFIWTGEKCKTTALCLIHFSNVSRSTLQLTDVLRNIFHLLLLVLESRVVRQDFIKHTEVSSEGI